MFLKRLRHQREGAVYGGWMYLRLQKHQKPQSIDHKPKLDNTAGNI